MKIFYRSIFLLAMVVLLGFDLSAQNVKLKGSIIDSTATQLIGATVVLLQPKDSVMVSYALSDYDGNFVLNNITPGNYFLQISYIGYGNFRQNIEVKTGLDEQNLGSIFLSSKNTLLEEIVVKAEHVPIIIKNDTIEYNAAAFKTKPNAAVVDLLKRLPGVEVQRDGSIKAQGKDVENVFVDGKEFFGKDPKIATQNLPADAVDKVQVYDKKSEMAEFSGIEDGLEEKTINLSLKDGKKKGYFGNIQMGFGADDPGNVFDNERYKGKLSINRFDSKMQLSMLGMTNNVNDQGFSFNDYINFMGGLGSFMSGGKMEINLEGGGPGGPLGNGGNSGITSTAAGGLNFNIDFNDKIDWQSSYFINRINNHTLQSTSSQNLAGQKSFARLDNSDRNNVNLNHRLNTTLRIKSSAKSELKWSNRLTFNSGDMTNSSGSQTFGLNQSIENHSINSHTNEGDQFGWFSDLTYRQKLKKVGRVFSANFNLNLGDISSMALIDNGITFYESGSPNFFERVMQDQNSLEDQTQYGLRVTYTEPLSKKTFLGFNASKSNYRNERVRDYFDIDPDNPSARTLNVLLSNRFQRDYNFNKVGATVRMNSKSVKMTGGLSLQMSGLDGMIVAENLNLSKDFTNILPNFSFYYDFASSKNLKITYRTSIQEPSLEQLQPIIDNTNPLNIYEGNPNLKPEYVHSTNVHLMLYDQFTFTSFFVNWNTRYTNNRIVNKSNIDELFRQIQSPINVDNDFNTNLSLNFSTPLKFMKAKISLDTRLGYNRGILFVNELENYTDRWTSNYRVTLENRKKDVIDVAAGVSLGRSKVNYSESVEFNQSYLDQTYFTDFIFFLKKGWTIESSLDFTKYSAELFADQDDLMLWKASISKSFLANERGTLELSVFDILNQNQGIDRVNRLNYIQEVRTNVLGRYLMLSFNYKLSKLGQNGGGIVIENSRH